MQQTGTLKKRRKRNLAKVTGLSLIPYEEESDTRFGIYDVYEPGKAFDEPKRNSGHVNVKMTRIKSHRERIRSRSSYPMSEYIQEEENIYDFEDNDGYQGRPPSYSSAVTEADQETILTHLLSNRTLARLKQLLILGAYSGTFPWKWNQKKMRIDLWHPKMVKLWKIFWFFCTLQTAFLTGFQFYSFFDRITSEHHSYRQIFMASLSVYWYICAIYFNVNMYKYKDQIRQYINTMLKMNKLYVEKYVITMDGYQEGGRILINLSIPSNCSQVFASVILFCVMPYQPWYLYSYIYKKTNPWYYLIPGALQEFVVVGQVITNYMMTSWIVVAHTNSVEFWLREIHQHNDTGFTMESLRSRMSAIKMYRSLQVLCTCFNDCMSPMAIPMVKIHIMTGLIPCGYVLIRSMNQTFIDEFPGILTYPIGVIDCATAGFAILSMAAEMYDLAISFVDSWSRTKQKDFRRILKSFPVLKVRVGHYYFITVSTTVKFFKTTLDYVIDCIITFP